MAASVAKTRWDVAKQSSQKFIARNRAPRVQIEYDVEVYGAEKKVQVPFVMGVLSDLSGKSAEELPPVDERKPLEIDVDNFDSRLKAMKPRVAFAVPNTLTGEGNSASISRSRAWMTFSPGGGRAQGGSARQAARGAHATGEPRDLHGRQGGR
jgi:type VI secretion system protein ImpB